MEVGEVNESDPVLAVEHTRALSRIEDEGAFDFLVAVEVGVPMQAEIMAGCQAGFKLEGIVGNEDGAHWSSAQLIQTLNDTGWTIPAAAACYWVGEAMGSIDIKDLDPDFYHSLVGWVSQEPVLFAGTVRDNLLMGRFNFSCK